MTAPAETVVPEPEAPAGTPSLWPLAEETLADHPEWSHCFGPALASPDMHAEFAEIRAAHDAFETGTETALQQFSDETRADLLRLHDLIREGFRPVPASYTDAQVDDFVRSVTTAPAITAGPMSGLGRPGEHDDTLMPGPDGKPLLTAEVERQLEEAAERSRGQLAQWTARKDATAEMTAILPVPLEGEAP